MLSTLLLAPLSLLALTHASPLPSTSTSTGTVTLQIGISLTGDDSSTRNIPFNTLTPGAPNLPQAATLVVSSGNDVSIANAAIVCQAFGDAAGKVKLGATFNNVLPGIKLSTTELTTIGSVFCSDAKAVAAFSATSTSTSTTSSSTTTSASTSTVTATIQIDFSGEGAAQGAVPVNGELTPAKGKFASPVASSAAIESVEGADAAKVSCEVFGDAEGKNLLATVKGSDGDDTPLSTGADVPVAAFKCSLA